jgi:hypothetical protein
MFPSAKVTEDTKTDYLYWAVIHKADIEKISTMIDGIDYPNFKDSVKDRELHDAYVDVWAARQEYNFRRHTQVGLSDRS